METLADFSMLRSVLANKNILVVNLCKKNKKTTPSAEEKIDAIQSTHKEANIYIYIY
jgi:hypothetical protein